MHRSMYMNDRGQLTKFVFSFPCGVLRDQTQVVSLGDKLLHPLSYLFSLECLLAPGECRTELGLLLTAAGLRAQ